jgi:hypothetical protein
MDPLQEISGADGTVSTRLVSEQGRALRIDWRPRVEDALSAAIRGRSKLPPSMLSLPGYSSPRIRHFLNVLASGPEVRFLEIGTWKGSTLLAAAYDNPGIFVGIDNFSQFRYRQIRSPRTILARHRAKFASHCRVDVVESDAWLVSVERLPAPVNIYFYDGDHSEESHYRAFSHFDPAFDRDFVAIVDDWNWDRVRRGTRRAFEDLGYSVESEHELITDRNGARSDWWNGLWVGVVRKTR